MEGAALDELLSSRRSVRRFDQREVPAETVERLLAAACSAPSAHGSAPWRFVVLARGERRRLLAAPMAARFRADLVADGVPTAVADRTVKRAERRLVAAPLAIVLCLDSSALKPYLDGRRRGLEHELGVQGVAIAGGYLLLAAQAEGLGACWMAAPLFAADEARAALDLPSPWEPQGLVLAGFPAEPSLPRLRRPAGEVTNWL